MTLTAAELACVKKLAEHYANGALRGTSPDIAAVEPRLEVRDLKLTFRAGPPIINAADHIQAEPFKSTFQRLEVRLTTPDSWNIANSGEG
jgi:hypothetical protein